MVYLTKNAAAMACLLGGFRRKEHMVNVVNVYRGGKCLAEVAIP